MKVYQYQNSGDLLGTVVVCEVHVFSAKVYAKPKGSKIALEQYGVALKSRAGKEEQVRVYIADKSLKKFVKKIDPNLIQLVERDDGAEFDMALDGGKVLLNIYDFDATKNRFIRMSHRFNYTFEDISSVIRSAAHFYWHRRRTPQISRGLAKRVEIRVNKLEEDFDDELFKPFFKPVATSGALEVGKALNLHTETTYGWTITNKVNLPLYPALFFFDNTDWSISEDITTSDCDDADSIHF